MQAACMLVQDKQSALVALVTWSRWLPLETVEANNTPGSTGAACLCCLQRVCTGLHWHCGQSSRQHARVQIKWKVPDETGGLPILQYELQQAEDPDVTTSDPVSSLLCCCCCCCCCYCLH